LYAATYFCAFGVKGTFNVSSLSIMEERVIHIPLNRSGILVASAHVEPNAPL
jgi:hypothetical protein